MKALVISGGGAKGAWAGGAAHALYDKGQRWDLYVGCSTGSLLATLLPSDDFAKVKTMYTDVNANSIFSVNPFNKKGKINVWNALWRVITKKTSLGESGNLKKILTDNFTNDDYLKMMIANKSAVVATTNITKGIVEHFNSAEMKREDFIDIVIASSSVPVAMSPVTYKNCQYLDGGIMQHIPVSAAIDAGADEIDIIILRPETFPNDSFYAKNIFDVVSRSIDLMQREVSFSDAMIGHLTADVKKDIILNFYYTPCELTNNSLDFDKSKMEAWWNEGYDFIANDKTKRITFHVCNSKKRPSIKRFENNVS
jgi:predicted patatin/cPLA2 family phospholipase